MSFNIKVYIVQGNLLYCHCQWSNFEIYFSGQRQNVQNIMLVFRFPSPVISQLKLRYKDRIRIAIKKNNDIGRKPNCVSGFFALDPNHVRPAKHSLIVN